MTVPDLEIGCTFASLEGSINANSQAAGYQLHSESRSQRQVSYRKQEVTSSWVAGTYVVHAVRENVVENISVWVRGTSHGEMQDRLDALLTIVESPVFTVTWTFPTSTEIWNCQYGDYTVRLDQAFQHATMALVQIQAPRLPRVNVPGALAAGALPFTTETNFKQQAVYYSPEPYVIEDGQPRASGA